MIPRSPSLRCLDADQKRAEISTYFNVTSELYESLFQTLANDEAYVVAPISLRHPLIFYLGHTATFFVNKLALSGQLRKRIEPRFESMFAVGVDEMSWDDLNSAHYDWPPVNEVWEYRRKVRAVVQAQIDSLPLSENIGWESPWWPILMGIEHERIHLETSSVLIRQHQLRYVRPHPAWAVCAIDNPLRTNRLIPVAAGEVVLDKQKDALFYGWDNEYGRHEASVDAFEASQLLVSNGEFRAFVDDGGYEQITWWEGEQGRWRADIAPKHPTFWVKRDGAWLLRLMTHEIPMPWSWPVEVNYHEAKAFCRWKQAQGHAHIRLPTEDEWYRLRSVAGVEELSPTAVASANIHLDHWASSCPVDQFSQGPLFDVVGNVWQWTETPIYPFSGFQVHPLYDDFTTPTFDNEHHLMKGGSWISCGNEALASARYAFRRHFFQHAGFRYIQTEKPLKQPVSRYENDRLLSEYAEFHYGDSYFGVANFPAAMAELAVRAHGARPRRRALDLGCASGRATFELAKAFEHVTGVDFSARFIGQGVQLQQQGTLRYTLTEEGDLVEYRERTLERLGLSEGASKVDFVQGDACNLKPQLRDFDLILAANLIDRLYEPKKFLSSIHEHLCLGGLLVIASPYTWLEEHTPKDQWVGGFKRNGERCTTLGGLNEILEPHFAMRGSPQEVPLVIRETRRKYQHSVSEVTIWERVS